MEKLVKELIALIQHAENQIQYFDGKSTEPKGRIMQGVALYMKSNWTTINDELRRLLNRLTPQNHPEIREEYERITEGINKSGL